jgi:hypothetical protein
MKNDHTNSIPAFADWIYESWMLTEQVKGQTFEEFAQARHDGAKEISDAAKKKGGNALLTYEHFRVKLPYYKKAAEGKFKMETAKSQLGKLMKKLDDGTVEGVSMGQTQFQRLVGEIEVVGELIIKFKEIGKGKEK